MDFVVVIEPNPLLRIGILHLLSKANIALNLAHYHYEQIKQLTNEAPPDLVIFSISQNDNISQVAKDITNAFSPTPILLLSDTPEAPRSVYSASELIAGCIYRHAAPEVLQASAQLILAGGRCFPNFTGQSQAPLHDTAKHTAALSQPEGLLLTEKTSSPATESTAITDIKTDNEAEMLGLTPRQYEVLVLLARGYPMKTVGRHLNISVATAKAHTESLYQRLDVRNRNAAVYTAISRGATLGWESISNHQTSSNTVTNQKPH